MVPPNDGFALVSICFQTPKSHLTNDGFQRFKLIIVIVDFKYL
jgi:hypothetical protein